MGSTALTLAAAPYVRSLPEIPNPVTFVDVARSAGITFQHDNAASPEKYLIETMGAGCAWIDYNPVSYTHLDVYKRQLLTPEGP